MVKFLYILCGVVLTLGVARVTAAAPRKVVVTSANIERFLQLPRKQRGAVRWCRLIRSDLKRGPIVQSGYLITRGTNRWFIPKKGNTPPTVKRLCRQAFLDRFATHPGSVSPKPPRCTVPTNAIPLSSEEELAQMNDPHGSYILMNDIMISRALRTRFADREFLGSFEGCHYTLYNLSIEDHESLSVGLFGMLGRGASVRNLMIINPQLASDSAMSAGILAGLSEGIVDNVHIQGGVMDTSATWIGGLLGFHRGTTPRNSTALSVLNGETDEVLRMIGQSHTN